MDPLLSVEDLHVEYRTPRGVLAAVKGVTLNVERREVVGLVGETGSGKSTIARAVVNRVRPPGQIPQGRIMFNGQDLLGLSPKEMRQVRGRKIALIIQNPAAALNPLLTVNTQFMNVHHAHGEGTKESAKAKILDLLHQVQLRDPQRVLDTYAHQLSGGMAQRVMIAMALLHSPELLIADEATTGLDATIQAHILDLLAELVNQYQMSALVITHEMGIVLHYCQRVIVLFEGEIVEEGPVSDVFAQPRHPYTQKLLSSSLEKVQFEMPEAPPTPVFEPERNGKDACAFRFRCPYAFQRCGEEHPDLVTAGPRHQSRCFLVDGS